MAHEIDPGDWGVSDKKQDMPLAMAFLFFGAFFLVGLIFTGFLGYKLFQNLRALTVFQQTECVVLGKRLIEHSDSDGTTYGVELRFRYRVGNKPYERRGYDVLGGTSSGRASKENILDRYEVGSISQCWYDPSEPEFAVLDRSLSWVYLFLLLSGFFVFLGGAGLYANLFPSAPGLGATRKAFPGLPVRRARAPSSGSRSLVGRPPVGMTGLEAAAGEASLANWPGTAAAAGSTAEAGKWLPPVQVIPGRWHPYRLTPPSGRMAGFLGGLFFALFWNGIVSVFVSEVVSGWARGSLQLFETLFLLPFLAVGIGLIVWTINRFLVWVGIGETRLELDRWPLHVGESVRYRLAQEGKMFLNSLTMTLHCEEEATYRRGTDTITKKEPLIELPVAHAGGVNVDHWRPHEMTGTIKIPACTAHSFKSEHNAINWRLEVKGDVANWPDFTTEFTLIVLPREGPCK